MSIKFANARESPVYFFSSNDYIDLFFMMVGVFYLIRSYNFLYIEIPNTIKDKDHLSYSKAKTLSILMNAILGVSSLFFIVRGLVTVYNAAFWRNSDAFANAFLANFRDMKLKYFLFGIVALCVIFVPLFDFYTTFTIIRSDARNPSVYTRMITDIFAFIFSGIMVIFAWKWASMKDMR